MGDETRKIDSRLPEKDASAYLASGFLVGGGRFTLLHELAKGGMGVVWLAHDERLSVSVALKFLGDKVRSDPSALSDLRQETHKSRMLSHPNIVRIYDLYEAPDEAPFISMEYVDGPSLWTLLKQQQGAFFTWDYLRPIVKQLCEALNYAHEEGVIHRDLKPGNMLLGDKQRLRLADFGIAMRASAAVGVADAERFRGTGTLMYMSPQQFDGKPPDATDDIYALGATLYEFLSGHPPFFEHDIGYQVRHVLPAPLEERLLDLEIANEIPPAVAAMIMACLAKDPEKRPPTARAVAEWIGLTDGTIAAAGTSTVPVSNPVAPPPSSRPPLPPPPTTVRSRKPLPEVKRPTTIKPIPPATITPAHISSPPPPAENVQSPPPPQESTSDRRFTMIVGAIVVGVVAWLAWSHFIPRMPALPTAPETTNTNEAVAPAPATTNTGPAAPVVATATGTNVTIELGQNDLEKGLRLVTGPEDGATSPRTIGGKDCRLLLARPRARCYFAILPQFKSDSPMSVRVEVEYYAAAPGALQIQYDGRNRQTPHYTPGGRIGFTDEPAWHTANFQLNNALFRNGEDGGADFRLTTTSLQLYIHSVTLFFDQ
jgi:serine/threonine protein kinase